jgi:excisionase family DNA binding protein
LELLVSTAEGARRIGVGKTKFFELLKEEQIKAVRIGRRTLIPTAELDRFVAGLPVRGTLNVARIKSVDVDAARGVEQ